MIFAGDPTPWLAIWCIGAAILAALFLFGAINTPKR